MNPHKSFRIAVIFLLISATVFAFMFYRLGNGGLEKEWEIVVFVTSFITTLITLCTVLTYRGKCKGYCSACGEKLKSNDFVYVLGPFSTTENSVQQTVVFGAVCSHCHTKQKKFEKKFDVKYIDSNGWQRTYDIEEEVEEYIDRLCK